jgi:uncharacterized protein YlxW (UPF0749 family)
METPLHGELPAEPDHHWVWQVTALSLALGILLALALRTTGRLRDQGLWNGRSASTIATLQEQSKRLDEANEKLREEVTRLQSAAENGKSAGQLLRDQIRRYKALSGYAPVRGPGLEIVLRNSPQSILPGTEDQAESYLLDADVDVRGVVNELFAAGAEALAIAGAGDSRFERFVVQTTVRAQGRSAVVNGRVLNPPFRVRAIGNPRELYGALSMPEGIIQVRGLKELDMITVKESQSLELPAFVQSPTAGSRVGAGQRQTAARP